MVLCEEVELLEEVFIHLHPLSWWVLALNSQVDRTTVPTLFCPKKVSSLPEALSILIKNWL